MNKKALKMGIYILIGIYNEPSIEEVTAIPRKDGLTIYWYLKYSNSLEIVAFHSPYVVLPLELSYTTPNQRREQ